MARPFRALGSLCIFCFLPRSYARGGRFVNAPDPGLAVGKRLCIYPYFDAFFKIRNPQPAIRNRICYIARQDCSIRNHRDTDREVTDHEANGDADFPDNFDGG